MEAKNIKAVLSALQEYAGPLEDQEAEVLAAVAELTAITQTDRVLVNRARMEKAIESIERVLGSDTIAHKDNVLGHLKRWLTSLLGEK